MELFTKGRFAEPQGNACLTGAHSLCHHRRHGFAVVDALTALAIIAATLVAGFQAVNVARRLAASALEGERIATDLRYLASIPMGKLGGVSGETEAGRWRMTLRPLRGGQGIDGAWPVCERRIEHTSARRNRRTIVTMAAACPGNAFQ